MPSLKPPASLFALAGISAVTSAVTAAPIVYFLSPHSHSERDAELRLPVKTAAVATTALNPFLLMPTASHAAVLPAHEDPAPKQMASADGEYAVATLEVVPVTVDRLPDVQLPPVQVSTITVPSPPKRPTIRLSARSLRAAARHLVRTASVRRRQAKATLSYAEPAPAPARFLNARTYPALLLPGRGKITVTTPIAPGKPVTQALAAPPLPIGQGGVAVYDIASATLYMPDGNKLEAHSGLRRNRDNANSVRLRNQGPTPSGEYTLSMRERPFFGVEALRMTPIKASYTFGRSGFLAHSYLAGPGGDSHGCVSVKNYGKLLQAYRKGQVKRIMVVAQYARPRTIASTVKRWWMASANRSAQQ